MRDPVQYTLEHLDDYLHGLLSKEDAAYVEEQCEKSKVCAAALEEAHKRFEALKAIPPSEASEKLIRQTLEGIDVNVTRKRRNWTIFSLATVALTAAAALIIGCFNVYYYFLAPTPWDVRLLGQDQFRPGSSATLHVGVFGSWAQPVANVPVEIALVNVQDRKEVTLASFTTDAGGAAAPRFELPDWPDGRYELRVTARPPGATESVSRTVQLRREWKLMLSTDKPVYQPGQKIHLRSLALRQPDLKPVAGQETTFSITDPKGNLVFRRHDVTSRYGLASADFQLATEVNEGKYEIACRVGETTSRRSVEVERYVLPKFRVTVDLDQPFYAPGQRVTGSVEADYFFGQPVAGAGVLVEVGTTGFDSRPAAEPVKLKTDAQGRAAFEFRLPDRLTGREQDGGNARVQIFATVTDTAGQAYVASASRIVAAEPIHLSVIPEGGTLVKGIENIVYVYASYADGRPAQVKLITSGNQQEIATNALGVAELKLTPSDDNVSLTLRATDDAGRSGRRHVNLMCGQVAGDFIVRPDRAVYDGGATVTLSARGGGVEPVFVDLLKDGQTMLSETIDMSGSKGAAGKGDVQIDLPADVFGTLRLVAFRYDVSGLPIRKERLIFVRQPRELSIDARLDAEQYRPGDEAKLVVKLTDAGGKPVVGAVSLAAVDEAVFSVLNQSSGMERVFFLLEQDLLKPVYAIYDRWSPDAGGAAPGGVAPSGGVPSSDREEFNRALFSRTASSATGSHAVPQTLAGSQTLGQLVEGKISPEEVERQSVVAVQLDNVTTGASYRSPFTLSADSFPAKRRSVEAWRESGLAGVVTAWISLAATLVVVGMAAFAVYRPKVFLITAGVMTAVVVPGLCMLFVAAVTLIPAYDLAQSADGAAESAVGMAQGSEGMAMPVPGDAAVRPRVREFFPETLYWEPELVTDEHGVLTRDIPLADSITTWRLSASAVSAEGRLGAVEVPIKVFQPFFVDLNLPVALTRGDTAAVPVVVYNYLDEPQTVKLTLEDADWFSRLEQDQNANGGPLTLELGPREVRSIAFPIKVEKVGRQKLEVTAAAGDAASPVADAIRREIEVLPNGRPVETVASGMLDQPAEVPFTIPGDAVEGGNRAIVKLYPSTFSQVVEGLDAILQMPHGCFEQTSSTTYPNVLALDYLRRTNKSVPAVEAQARQYINVGYQRLISFEVAGGGFDWFGHPPANERLTAYGLMEFEDMARVHDVDPRLIDRTRRWLLARRNADGTWRGEQMLNDGLAGSIERGRDPSLAANAYIAWAVFGSGKGGQDAEPTLRYLLSQRPESIENPYVLATVICAIAGIDPQHEALPRYLDRLAELAHHSDDAKLAWWSQPQDERSLFYGAGRSGDIESTAMAVLAMLKTKDDPGTATAALRWLVEQKDPAGTWHSTQATVLALKALLEGSSTPLGENTARHIEISLDGQVVQQVDIPADQADVMQQLDLSDLLTAGEHLLALRETTGTGTGYQAVVRHYVETPEESSEAQEPLSIEIAYDRQRLDVDETVTALARVTNNLPQAAPMVILDLPVPGGFTLEPGELDELQGSGKLARYQLTPRKAIIYLRALPAGETLELRYRLRATMAVKVAVPPGVAYEYYNPDHRGAGKPAELEAVAAE